MRTLLVVLVLSLTILHQVEKTPGKHILAEIKEDHHNEKVTEKENDFAGVRSGKERKMEWLGPATWNDGTGVKVLHPGEMGQFKLGPATWNDGTGVKVLHPGDLSKVELEGGSAAWNDGTGVK